MSRFLKITLTILLCILHAALLVVGTIVLMNTDFMHGDEAWMVKNTAAVLRTLLPEPDKPPKEDWAFINVAYDKELIPRYDADGFPAGVVPITDRRKLGALFRVLSENPNYKYLVCDIYFGDSAGSDSFMRPYISKLPRSVFSYSIDDSGKAMPVIFKGINLGLVEYVAVDDEFLKFRFQRGDSATTPIRMFREVDSGTYEPGELFWKLNGKRAFNDFVLDFRIREFDLKGDKPLYPYQNLHFLTENLDIPGLEEEVWNFTKDRIVVIGAFEVDDRHETMYGNMAGPLILVNLYLALKNGDNVLQWGFIWFWLTAFSILSWLLFTTDDLLESWVERKMKGKNAFVQLLVQGASYLIILGLLSIVSFVLFNLHINFLFITIYFNAVEWARKWWRRRGKSPEKPVLSPESKTQKTQD